jgi:hypothetical protein
MTSFPLPAPRLVTADLLKLRRRRGLAVVVGLLTLGAVAITYSVLEILHLIDPTTHEAAGGIENLGLATFIVTVLGSVAAAIVGSLAGAGDLDAGVYRDLVITGRSRVSLLLSRIPAGLAYLLPLVAAACVLAAGASVVFASSGPIPDARLMTLGGLWTVLEVTFYYLLAIAIACLIGSRSYTIGVVLALRFPITALLASISSLGDARGLVPGVAIRSLAPAGFGDSLRQPPLVSMSAAATAAVLLVWVLAALGLGGWRDATRDA